MAACPIWTAFMKVALEDQPVTDFTVPKDVTQVHIDPANGLRAYPGGRAQLEYFVAGSEPEFARTVTSIFSPRAWFKIWPNVGL